MATITSYGRPEYSHSEPCQCCGKVLHTYGWNSSHKCSSCIWHELYLPGASCIHREEA